MKLGTFKRIFKTDYKAEEQALVEKLANSINIGFESLYNAMSKNVDLTNNILCTVKDITIKVDSSGIPTGSASFKLDTVGQIKGISVIKATNLTDSTTYPTGAPFLTYTQDNTNITVVHAAGLPANNNFQLTVIAWG